MTLRLVKDDNDITLTGTVKDDGVGRNLTGATIAVILKVDGTAHTITGTADGDQTTNPGKFTATLTSTHLAASGKGEIEVQVTDGSAVITYAADAADVAIVRADLS
jgi:TctA family transporter